MTCFTHTDYLNIIKLIDILRNTLYVVSDYVKIKYKISCKLINVFIILILL